MKMEEISFFEWQSRLQSKNDCLDYLQKMKWPASICPQCGHAQTHFIQTRQLYQHGACQHQTSVKARTLFRLNLLPLRKWFCTIYFMRSDKGGISAVRLGKLIAVNWRTAWLILKKLREAMGHRDSLHFLRGVNETHHHEARVTSLVDEWLPWVHIKIDSLKTFLLDTFHSVSGKYLHTYKYTSMNFIVVTTDDAFLKMEPLIDC